MNNSGDYAWSLLNAEYRYYDECESTNDLALSWIKNAEYAVPEGSVVCAGFQTKGRGRRGKSWKAARKENLLMSVVMKPPYKLERLWKIAYVAGIAVANTLHGLNIGASLKWPNDVLINGKKAAGILIESAQYQENGIMNTGVVVGIGLNINQSDFGVSSDPNICSELSEIDEYGYPPTSMQIETDSTYDIDDICKRICERLSFWEQIHRSEYKNQSGSIIINEWRRLMQKNAIIRQGDIHGYLEDIDSDGSALIRLQNGTFTYWRTVEG